LVLAGHGVGGASVIDGWDARRLLAVVYHLATEAMDEGTRKEFDATLTAAEPATATRAYFAALAGGEEVTNGRIPN
jgi:hypothetical protein